METVYHVSNNGDGESGIFSTRAFRIRYPYVQKMFSEQDVDYVQFGDSSENVIIKEEPRSKFRADQIIT